MTTIMIFFIFIYLLILNRVLYDLLLIWSVIIDVIYYY